MWPALHRVFALTVALTVALVVGAAPVAAQDRWSRPAHAVRYLQRTVHLGGVDTVVHAAYVDLCDPAVELRATAPGERGRAVDAWARDVGAVVAVNGDYFARGAQRPLGPARGGGTWWPDGPREHRDALLAMGPGGAVSIFDAPPSGAALWDDAAERVGPRWTEVVAVRERVLVAGAVRQSPFIVHEPLRHPRTAVGLSADAHTLILAVVDGRSENSGGATTRELGRILADLGAREGMKLDGGGSSTLFIQGLGVVNRPSDGAPRVVANHLGVRLRSDVPPGAPSRCPVGSGLQSPDASHGRGRSGGVTP